MKIIKHLKSDWFRYGFETLAVLVGILAAFALENWNEERRSATQTDVFLKHIVTDISEDIEEMNELMVHVDETIQRAESLIGSFKFGSLDKQEATIFIGWLNLEKSFHVNRSGIDALINSGRFDLLLPDLTVSLQRYYALCDKLAEQEFKSNIFIRENYEPYYFDQYMEATRMGDVYGIREKYVDDPREQYLIKETEFLTDSRMEILVLIRLVHSEAEKEIYLQLMDAALNLQTNIERLKPSL